MNRHFTELTRIIPDIKHRRVLDVGSGRGAFLVALAEEGVDAVGIELSDEYIARTQKRASAAGVTVNVHHGRAERMPFEDVSFGVVNCCEVIEHVENPDAVLREMHRVLQPGGCAYVSVPSRFGFRDPHFHLYGINWLPRRAAHALLGILGKHKDYSTVAGEQRLDRMYYDTFGGFVARVRGHGFAVTDARLLKLRGRMPSALRPLAAFAYRILRPWYFSTHHFLLTKPAAEPLRLYYITNARMPTEKAHGFQIAKTCEALGRAGVGTTLIVPRRRNTLTTDVYEHYDLEHSFSTHYLSALDLLWLPLPRINFYLTSLAFLLRIVFVSVPKDVVIYTRSPEIAWYFSRFGTRTVVFEAHTWPRSLSWLQRRLLRSVDLIVANSEGTAGVYREQGFENILTARNGVDIAPFAEMPTQEEARKEFGLPLAKTIALYVGRFEEWKGIEVILEAARHTHTDDSLLFAISGGTPEEEEKLRTRTSEEGLANLVLVPAQFGRSVPRLLACADVLLLPNTPVSEESRTHTSPIKTFSYMASGRPIVASDLPSIREVLSGENALLVPPGDAAALLAGIRTLVDNPGLARSLARRAREEVVAYTWDARVARVIERLHML